MGDSGMNKHSVGYIIILWAVFLLTGCATAEVYSSSPTVQKVSNPYFDAQLEPQAKEGKQFFNAFRLVLINKTNGDLKIDWEKTYYLLNGRKHGRFAWEGIDWEEYEKRNTQPLITIAPGSTFSKVIFPIKLIGRGNVFSSRTTTKYTRGVLPPGDNGIYLAIRQDEKEIDEKLILNITAR
jgi:hypothetical protein